MPRKPIFESFWQGFSASYAWVVVTAAIGAVSFYMFFTKKTDHGDGRQRPTVILPRSSEGGSSLLTRLRKHQLPGCKLCIAWEVLAENDKWRDGAKKTFETFAWECDIYLMCRIKSEQERANILATVRGISGLSRHKILFCETEKGYDAFCRQIKPSLVIMHDEKEASFLSTVLPGIALVGAKTKNPNVTCLSSFHELLS